MQCWYYWKCIKKSLTSIKQQHMIKFRMNIIAAVLQACSFIFCTHSHTRTHTNIIDNVYNTDADGL